MNAQDYISSGLLEAYVLGGLNLTESEQVAGAICRFPEVAEAIARLEEDLFHAAQESAVAPPPGLEDKIWAAIQAEASDNTPAEVILPATTNPEPEIKRPKVIALEGGHRSATASWARAAMIALLLGSVATNFIIWNRSEKVRDEIANERDGYKRLYEDANNSTGKVKELTAQLERYRHEADMMADPEMKPVPMLSTQPGHPMAATMYWNKSKGEAYVSVQKLPPPPAGMQYQLWAIADGKPVDIGMLDNEVALSGGMQKVSKAVASGQAFAVSLEKAGGSPSPTPDKIFLMGKMPA